MNIKGFILYKGKDFNACDLVIKNGEIVEYNSGYFKGIFPKENNSALSAINEILKVHNPERIQNSCKYYIQHSIDGEVMNIYLDINKFQYWKLKWQLKKYIIQAKEFKIGIIIAVIAALLAVVGFFVQESINTIEKDPAEKNVNEIKNEPLNTLILEKDSTSIKKDSIK